MLLGRHRRMRTRLFGRWMLSPLLLPLSILNRCGHRERRVSKPVQDFVHQLSFGRKSKGELEHNRLVHVPMWVAAGRRCTSLEQLLQDVGASHRRRRNEVAAGARMWKSDKVHPPLRTDGLALQVQWPHSRHLSAEPRVWGLPHHAATAYRCEHGEAVSQGHDVNTSSNAVRKLRAKHTPSMPRRCPDGALTVPRPVPRRCPDMKTHCFVIFAQIKRFF